VVTAAAVDERMFKRAWLSARRGGMKVFTGGTLR